MEKNWEKPRVVIIAKSTTEENVLESCKRQPDMDYDIVGPSGTACWSQTWPSPTQLCNPANNS